MDSGWRISCWIIPIYRNRIRPKSEELAAPGPMKSSRTRRVCTLRMLLLVQRCYSPGSLAGGRLFALSQSSRGPFFFQALNCDLQPVSAGLFDLVLIALPIERIQCLTG